MPIYKKVVYLVSDDDEFNAWAKRLNEEWNPIYWLIEVLVGPDNLLHNDQILGIIKKIQRLEELDKYLETTGYLPAYGTKEEVLLKRVVEKCFGLMPKLEWIKRACEIEDAINHWDISLGIEHIKYLEEPESIAGVKYYSEFDKNRECWKISSTEKQDHDGDNANTWVADVFDPNDVRHIVALLNKG